MIAIIVGLAVCCVVLGLLAVRLALVNQRLRLAACDATYWMKFWQQVAEANCNRQREERERRRAHLAELNPGLSEVRLSALVEMSFDEKPK